MPRFEKSTKILLPLFGLSFLLIDCGSTLPPPGLEGLWTGSVTDSLGRPGTASLSLSEDRHDVLHGEFSYLASNCSADSRPVIGKVAQTQVSLSQTPSDPVLTSLQMVVNSTDQQLTGTYSDSNGECNSSGTIILTKPLNQTPNS